ncbi:MAG TPA: M3 family oligoendopeptidase [Phycisphaerales bacterium]|nr:M3 family oligoendopeptidase [Phycisphaerales bacterium]
MTAPASDLSVGFVAPGFDGADWGGVERLVGALEGRPVGSRAELERWILDRSDLDAACGESRANLYIAMTCRTDDAGASGAYERFVTEVQPRLREASFRLDRRLVELAGRFPLDERRFGVLLRNARADVALFRAESVPLMTEADRLAQKYQQLVGAMTVEFEGEERPLPRMAPFLQDLDRPRRERAWRGVAERRLRDRAVLEDVFDGLLSLRHRVALNAGFADFRDYSFQALHRFDYSPADCGAFHSAVERRVVPVMRAMDDQRARALGHSPLRPWDLAVDERGRPPLRPFTDGADLLEKTRRVFDRMDPGDAGLGEMFRELGDDGTPGECLDLDSRRGKAPGGYQYMRDGTRRPFIFMNAAGLHRDVETMLHEAGHSFHSQLCRAEPLVWYREAPTEFAEVASMSMEMLSMPQWGEYYPDARDRARAEREQLAEHGLVSLAWIAQIDAFQHWLYTHPGHTRAARSDAWLALDERFGRRIAWDGLEEARAHQWHRQLHLFLHPFYYIEYAIARLGALGLWLHSLERGQASALERYKRALTLGGSRPLPELFEAAGLPLNFDEQTVGRLIDALRRELARAGE